MIWREQNLNLEFNRTNGLVVKRTKASEPYPVMSKWLLATSLQYRTFCQSSWIEHHVIWCFFAVFNIILFIFIILENHHNFKCRNLKLSELQCSTVMSTPLFLREQKKPGFKHVVANIRYQTTFGKHVQYRNRTLQNKSTHNVILIKSLKYNIPIFFFYYFFNVKRKEVKYIYLDFSDSPRYNVTCDNIMIR